MAVVLDASAVLAFVQDENGADRVLPHIGNAIISAVNLQEVIKEMMADGLVPEQVAEILAGLKVRRSLARRVSGLRCGSARGADQEVRTGTGRS